MLGMKSWKTSLGGVGMILGAVADIAMALYNGTTPNWDRDFIAICGGVALLFAKDGDLTGGSRSQPTVPNRATLTEKFKE
jgi:hypothetical protein